MRDVTDISSPSVLLSKVLTTVYVFHVPICSSNTCTCRFFNKCTCSGMRLYDDVPGCSVMSHKMTVHSYFKIYIYIYKIRVCFH